MIVGLSDVRAVLESDALVPCFQPIVELRTGKLSGFEVLARWRHPGLGYVLPQNFIALAERNGLIGELTRQIMMKAFCLSSVLPEPLFLAVNLSPVQLQYLSLPRQILAIAEECQFPLERLYLEITETAFVNNMERARKIAFELKEAGCKLALDDFGTGYSSLSHIQGLPFSKLKVDRNFVQSMTSQRESRKIVAAVIGLGYSLGMSTVAEGVETEEQADILLWLGCEQAQGWFYGRPVAADKLPERVAAAPQPLLARLNTQDILTSDAGLEELSAAHRLAQLHAIYNGAPVALCFVDTNLRYVSLNRRMADLNGAPVKDHIGKTVQEMIPTVFPGIEPYLLRALQGESIESVETTRPSPRPGETDLTVLFSYQPVFDEAHEVIGISTVVMDITQSKGAEESIRATDEHLFEQVPQMSWIADSQGNVIDISARWLQLRGLTKEQALNEGWMETMHPNDLPAVLKAIRESIQTGKLYKAEYRVKTAEGTWKWMRTRGWPRKNERGEIVRWYGGVEDIEEGKELERALFVWCHRGTRTG